VSDERVSFGEPHEPMTELCDVGLYAIVESPRWSEELRVLVMVVNEEGRCGTGLVGYDGPAQAFSDLFQQLRALASLAGVEVMIAPLNRG
jgi:hypothetical protein